ncbi:MAG: Hsp20/alpha crystallin family protein [Atribacterota bacterium]|jgi:HSP20 family protein|nr:Hsp20/alpha crystallin family protein [Atribacterota bacterium]
MVIIVYRFDSFRDLTLLQDRINRLFDDSMVRQERQPSPNEAWVPMVDITEDENEIVLWVDLPGVSQKEVDIIINGDQLTLKGEKKFDQTNQRKYLRRERLVGPFSRTFQLNLPVETEEISAAYRNGVLEIHLPKPAESKPRKVSIQTE